MKGGGRAGEGLRLGCGGERDLRISFLFSGPWHLQWEALHGER